MGFGTMKKFVIILIAVLPSLVSAQLLQFNDALWAAMPLAASVSYAYGTWYNVGQNLYDATEVQPASTYSNSVLWITANQNPSNYTPWTALDGSAVGANNGSQIVSTLRPVWSSGVLDFSSLTNIVSVPTNVAVSSPATLSFWIKIKANTVTSTGGILSISDILTAGTAGAESLRIGWGGGSTSTLVNEFIYIFAFSGSIPLGWTGFGCTSATNFENVWKHVAITFNGTNYAIFIDSLNQALSASSGWGNTIGKGQFADFITPGVSNVSFGAWVTGVTNVPAKALLDDLRIYNRVLTSNEVYTMYTSTTNPATPRP